MAAKRTSPVARAAARDATTVQNGGATPLASAYSIDHPALAVSDSVSKSNGKANNADLVWHLEHDEPVQAIMTLGPDELVGIGKGIGLAKSVVSKLAKIHEAGGLAAAGREVVADASRALAGTGRKIGDAMNDFQNAARSVLKGRAPSVPSSEGMLSGGGKSFSKVELAQQDRAIESYVAESNMPAPPKSNPLRDAGRALKEERQPASVDAVRKRAAAARKQQDAIDAAQAKGKAFVEDLKQAAKPQSGVSGGAVMPLKDEVLAKGFKNVAARPFTEASVRDIMATEPGTAARAEQIERYSPTSTEVPSRGGKTASAPATGSSLDPRENIKYGDRDGEYSNVQPTIKRQPQRTAVKMNQMRTPKREYAAQDRAWKAAEKRRLARVAQRQEAERLAKLNQPKSE